MKAIFLISVLLGSTLAQATPSTFSCFFSGMSEAAVVIESDETSAQMITSGPELGAAPGALNASLENLQLTEDDSIIELRKADGTLVLSGQKDIEGFAYRRIADMTEPERSPTYQSQRMRLRAPFRGGYAARLHLTDEQRERLDLEHATYIVGVCEN